MRALLSEFVNRIAQKGDQNFRQEKKTHTHKTTTTFKCTKDFMLLSQIISIKLDDCIVIFEVKQNVKPNKNTKYNQIISLKTSVRTTEFTDC